MEPETLHSPNEITWPNEILWQPTRMSSVLFVLFHLLYVATHPASENDGTNMQLFCCSDCYYLPPTTIDQQLIQLCKEAEKGIQAGMVPERWRKVLLQTNSLPPLSSAEIKMDFSCCKGKYGTKLMLQKMHIAPSAFPITLISFPLQHYCTQTSLFAFEGCSSHYHCISYTERKSAY